LAASCNSWFAQAAQRLDGVAVLRAIQARGGRANLAATREELVLAVLGLERVWFTPAVLARAYARLRQEGPASVRKGLEAAITYGTASQAATSGLLQAGKTGTVREGAWFAGWTDRAVIAVFVPGGTGGADAAPIAREILSRWHAGLPV
jgi:membrane carboxypeptidase/penicillin-binding protein